MEEYAEVFFIRVKKGVSPYGGRLFMAMQGRQGKDRQIAGWMVDTRSNSRTKYPADYRRVYTFGGCHDWRRYRSHEVELVKKQEGILFKPPF